MLLCTSLLMQCRPFYSSEFALWYNDRSVLENHHLNYAFTLLKEVRNTVTYLDITNNPHTISLPFPFPFPSPLPLPLPCTLPTPLPLPTSLLLPSPSTLFFLSTWLSEQPEHSKGAGGGRVSFIAGACHWHGPCYRHVRALWAAEANETSHVSTAWVSGHHLLL